MWATVGEPDEWQVVCRVRGAKGGRNGDADVAQLAERVLGKDEVTGSIPVIGSNLRLRTLGGDADCR